MATDYTKTCAQCGTENNADDLFCRNCGNSLPGTSQATVAFTPMSSSEIPSPDIAVPAAAADWTYAGTSTGGHPSSTYDPSTESIRGAVLGWISMVIIVLVIGAFAWAYLLTDAARNTVTGIF